MIFAYDHQGVMMTIETHEEEVSRECIIVFNGKPSQENAQEPTSVARGWLT